VIYNSEVIYFLHGYHTSNLFFSLKISDGSPIGSRYKASTDWSADKGTCVAIMIKGTDIYLMFKRGTYLIVGYDILTDTFTSYVKFGVILYLDQLFLDRKISIENLKKLYVDLKI
jgi:hypothetical protein